MVPAGFPARSRRGAGPPASPGARPTPSREGPAGGPYRAAATVYVAPRRAGGGTRLKVLEAMAMGKAIVSTPMGC